MPQSPYTDRDEASAGTSRDTAARLLVWFVVAASAAGLWFYGPSSSFENINLDNELRIDAGSSLADGAPISIGDRVVLVDGQPVETTSELRPAISNAPRVVPVRVVDPTLIATIELDNANVDSVIARTRDALRILKVNGRLVVEPPTEAEIRALVDRAEALPVQLGAAPAERVYDGGFIRTSGRGHAAVLGIGLLIVVCAAFLLLSIRALHISAGGAMLLVLPVLGVSLSTGGTRTAPLAFAGVVAAGGGVLLLIHMVLIRGARPRHRLTRAVEGSGDGGGHTMEASTGSLAAVLRHAESLTSDDLRAEFVVGFEHVGFRAALAADGSLRISRDSQARHAGLTILDIEGGTFPRAETWFGGERIEAEDDPLEGISAVGIRAASPLQATSSGHGTWVFLTLVDTRPPETNDPEGTATPSPSDAVSLDRFFAFAPTVSASVAAAVQAMAIDTMLRLTEQVATRSDVEKRPDRATSRASSQSAPGGEGKAPPPDAGQRALIDHHERRALADWPVDDSNALTSEHWRWIDPLLEGDAPFLIFGEPGTGKEFLARTVHRSSARGRGRILVLDLARVPAPVAEAELLGETPDGGLLAADGVSTVVLKSSSLMSETMLQRVMAEAHANDVRIGFIERFSPTGRSGMPADVPTAIRRLVANRWLAVPALRDRPGDTAYFAERFVHEYALRYQRVIDGLSKRAVELLESLELVGNLHELQAICHGAVLRAEDATVTIQTLVGATAGDVPEELARIERDDERRRLIDALRVSEGNKSEAARMLGLSRGSLLRRLKKHDLMD